MFLTLTLAACGGIEKRDGPGRISKAEKAPAVIPKSEPLSKYGNPASYVVFGKRYYTLKTAAGFKERGIASWYGKKFHGRKTSSGEVYDMYQMTAAHKNLPLPTYVKVKNLNNGRVITVRVNDRGPFHDKRIIDLSYAAANELGILGAGTAPVEIWAVNGQEQRLARNEPEKRNEPAGVQAAAKPDKLAEKVSEAATKLVKDEASLEQLLLDEFTDVALQTSRDLVNDVYLQVGAYKELQNARLALDRIVAFIPDARIQQAVAAGAPVYRVQVGPILDLEEADLYAEQLTSLGFPEHHIIAP